MARSGDALLAVAWVGTASGASGAAELQGIYQSEGHVCPGKCHLKWGTRIRAFALCGSVPVACSGSRSVCQS
jgi:hypothetical protein